MFAATLALCTALLFPQQQDGAAAIQARLDAYIAPYLAAGDFSGTILIARQHSILVSRAYGLADRAHGTPNTTDTRFRIASLTKTFTAAGILLLVQQGKLRLDDPLSRFFPEFPNGEHITVAQLLLHESGVGTLDEAEVFRDEIPTQELIRRLMQKPPLFAPGSSSSYSNEGYLLLASIIEKVSGLSYGDFLRKNLFVPLGMRHSGNMPMRWATVPKHAVGCMPGPQGVEPVSLNRVGWIGAGSLYATAPDLYRWLEAVRTNKLFSLASQRYPYGWGKRRYDGRDLIEQSGIVEGFNAYIAVYPKEQVDVVFLSNVQSGLFDRVPRDLSAIVFGGNVTRPPEVRPVTVSAEKLAEYAGAYTTPAIPAPMYLVVKDGSLYQQWGNAPFLRYIAPTGDDAFYSRTDYAPARFERNADGKVVKAVWTWSSGDPMTFVKTPAGGPH